MAADDDVPAKTTTTLRLACRCGALVLRVAEVSPANANRLACHCRGCTQFANDMRPEILDERGGTERVVVSPATVKVTGGHPHLACRQQTRGGALRWYAACCNTPLGLTLRSPTVPFIGLDVHTVQRNRHELDAVIGPLRARVNLSPRPPDARELRATNGALLSMLWHLIPLTWRWWRRGDHRRSPVFDDAGQPVVDVDRTYASVPALARSSGCR